MSLTCQTSRTCRTSSKPGRTLRTILALAALLLAPPAHAKLTPEQAKSLPPPATRPVSFIKDIRPILESSCIKCHGRGRTKGDFQLDTRETLLKGGATSPAVVPGKSEDSYLIELVSGLDPDNVMPKKGKKLTSAEVGLLRAWIDQGLAWEEGVSFAKSAPRNFTPRRPQLPANGVANPIDRILKSYFETNKVITLKPVPARLFARRVYLDLIGLLPSPEELERFVADKASNKREQLVKRLLADNQRYAEHWLSFWNDLLRNDYKGTGYIDGGRKQITGWLFAALANNLPYDKFVAQLVNPDESCEGFAKGIVWRGAVNASQTPPMQAAQNISQVFMGVNLKCASCHDSFINDWKLSDAYGLANIYAENPLEMFECDKPTGHKAPMQFIFPELGSIGGGTNRTERLKELAGVITKKENGRLSRTIVNRLWQKLLGRGLVEPVDDMEQTAWNPDLLDWLAEDFVEHGYDLKWTITQIVTSQAYQMPSVDAGETKDSAYVFRGPAVRRMSAEQFRDALGILARQWYAKPAAPMDVVARSLSPVSTPPRWIWSEAGAAHNAPEGNVYLRKETVLESVPREAFVVAACDNSYTLHINGQKAASGKDWTNPEVINIAKFLVKGTNTFAVHAVNGPAAAPEKSDKPPAKPAPNPAGFLLHARFSFSPDKVVDLLSDASWLYSTNGLKNWEKPEFQAEDWTAAADLGEGSIAPWNLEKKFSTALASTALYDRARASLVAADPLLTALGRPNREQVLTVRSSTATTLQMLELANGATLSKLLQKGAEHLLSDSPRSSAALVNAVYEGALGRSPTPRERQLAEELLGQPANKEGVEDFLWVVAALPEFQLIY